MSSIINKLDLGFSNFMLYSLGELLIWLQLGSGLDWSIREANTVLHYKDIIVMEPFSLTHQVLFSYTTGRTTTSIDLNKKNT